MRFHNEYGFYELNPLPGCNQVVVSNHAFIYHKHRGFGHGARQHEERLQKATEMGYNLIMCTVKSDNVAEIHILKSHGWKRTHTFQSTETLHFLEVWMKTL